jgi:hypothetical protein
MYDVVHTWNILLDLISNIFHEWRMVFSGMLRRVALVRTDVSEEPSASFIRVTRVGELGTTQAATSNRCMLWRNTVFLHCVRRLLVAACVVPRFLSPWWRRR